MRKPAMNVEVEGFGRRERCSNDEMERSTLERKVGLILVTINRKVMQANKQTNKHKCLAVAMMMMMLL